MNSDPIVIDNNFGWTACPCCDSGLVWRKGSFHYGKPQPYSSVSVSLLRKPELWKCRECDSGFICNAVSETDSRRLYEIGNSSSRWTKTEFEQSKTKKALKLISGALQNKADVMDVGCGSGSFLDFARRFGCQTTGVEYSIECQAILAAQGHHRFSSLDQVEGRFDLIVAFDLVEHLYDINRYLSLFHQRLVPGGSLVIITGDINCLSAKLAGAKWWYNSYPEHVVFPSMKFFSRLPGWRVRRKNGILASPYYEHSWKHTLKQTLKQFLRRYYTGVPSFVSDHLFLELVTC